MFQLAVEFGWESVAHTVRRREAASPFVAAIGYALIGCLVGLLSLLIVPDRLFPPSSFRGISLVLSPLITGLLMHAYGDYRRRRELPTTHLATFWGGATFAFSMAVVRFVAHGY